MSEESNLVAHAKRELAAKMTDPQSYDGMIATAVLELIEVFSKQGHSGFSAGLTISTFERLARYEPLGPLTGEDSEWCALDYAPDMAAQNNRCSHVFKRSDGTAYDSQGRVFRDPDGGCYTNGDSRVDISFPYTPKVEYVDVPAEARP